MRGGTLLLSTLTLFALLPSACGEDECEEPGSCVVAPPTLAGPSTTTGGGGADGGGGLPAKKTNAGMGDSSPPTRMFI